MSDLIRKDWRPASEKPDKSGQYLCTLWDKDGVFLALMEWNETFGGRWQAVFEGEDSYSDIGNVLAWMPLPEPYTEEEAQERYEREMPEYWKQYDIQRYENFTGETAVKIS